MSRPYAPLNVDTPAGPAVATVVLDPTTGLPATTDALTDAQLRASPVAVDPSTITATNALWNRMGANATVSKHFTHVLWTDGTQDGSSGGAFQLAGTYSPGSPRIVYRTFPTGAIITEFAFTIFGSGTFVASGWGTAVALTNGIRFEVTSGTPTDPAATPQLRLRPNGAGSTTLIRGIGEMAQLGGGGNASGVGQLGAVFINARPFGSRGLYVPAGSAFRVIVQDDTTAGGVSAFNVGIAGYEL